MLLDFVADTGNSGGTTLASSTAPLTVAQSAKAYDLKATKLFNANTARRTAAGLLVEGASSNGVHNSQDLTQSNWTNDTGATINPTGATAPDGTQTQNRINFVNGYQYFDRIRSNDGAYGTTNIQAWSFFFDTTSTGRYVHFKVIVNTASYSALFDLQNRAYLGAGYYDGTTQGKAPISGFVVPAGNGLYRAVFFVSETSGGGGGSPLIYFSQSAIRADQQWNGGEYVGLWGIQCEDGTAVSSYIPTLASPVSRPADNVTLTLPSGTGHVDLTYDNNTTATITASAGSFTIPANPANTNLTKLRAYA
jgi:hypothetical protein